MSTRKRTHKFRARKARFNPFQAADFPPEIAELLFRLKNRADKDALRKELSEARRAYEQAVLLAAKQRKQAILAAELTEKQAVAAAEREKAADAVALEKPAMSSSSDPTTPFTATPVPSVTANAAATALPNQKPTQLSIMIKRGPSDRIQDLVAGLRQQVGVRIIMVGGEGETSKIVVTAPSAKSVADWLRGLPFITETVIKDKEIAVNFKTE